MSTSNTNFKKWSDKWCKLNCVVEEDEKWLESPELKFEKVSKN